MSFVHPSIIHYTFSDHSYVVGNIGFVDIFLLFLVFLVVYLISR